MRSVLLMTLANLRYRRKQNLLVGWSILLSVLLLASALGILKGISEPFEQMFNRLKASHILLYYDLRQNDPDRIAHWLRQQDEVAHVTPAAHYFLLTEPTTFKQEKVDIMMRITEMGPHQENFDQLLGLHADRPVMPGWGEVWIPRHLSIKYDMQTGDTLLIPLSQGLFPLQISNIVVDPHYASGMINPNRIWIAPGMLPFMIKSSELQQVVQGIRLHSHEDIEKLWTRFNREFSYTGSNQQYKLFKSVFTSIYQIIAAMIIMFSLLAMIISGYMIAAILNSNLMSDSRLTGSLIALGYTRRQVTSTYVLQYMLIAILAIPAGLLLSKLSIGLMLRSLMKSLGVVNLDLPLAGIFLITALAMLSLLLLLISRYARKAAQVPPARALRSLNGNSQAGRTRASSVLKIEGSPLILWISFSFLSKQARKTLLSGLNLVLIAFMLGFAMNSSYSFSKIVEYRSAWGFDQSDLQISRSAGVILPLKHELLKDQLQRDSLVDELVAYSYYELRIPASAERAPIDLTGKVFESDPSGIGLGNISGRHPEGEGEISLCVGTASDLGKTIGDSVLVFLEQEARSFSIKGIYQDISNMGEGFRLAVPAVTAVNPLFEVSTYALILSDPEQKESYKKDLRKRYGEAIQVELTIEEQLGFLGIARNINASMILISLFFLGILVVSAYNDIYLSIWENRRSLGIYKLIGYTQAQLRQVMIVKSTLLALAGILLALPLVFYLGPRLMGWLTSGLGIVDFPFACSFTGTVLVYFLLILIAGLSSARAAAAIRQIKTRELVNE